MERQDRPGNGRGKKIRKNEAESGTSCARNRKEVL